MATVLSHIHFCPNCNDTWKCVSWMCEEEGGELICHPCRVKSRDDTKQKKHLAKCETQQNDRQRAHSERVMRNAP